jgi:hypothetical protein
MRNQPSYPAVIMNLSPTVILRPFCHPEPRCNRNSQRRGVGCHCEHLKGAWQSPSLSVPSFDSRSSTAFSHLCTVLGLTSNIRAISLMLFPPCFNSSILPARLLFKNLSFPQGSSLRHSGKGQLRQEGNSSQPLSS